jgi:hypothetical protein
MGTLRMAVQSWLFGSLAFAAVMASGINLGVAAAAPAGNDGIAGTWNATGTGNMAAQTWTITESASGSLSGAASETSSGQQFATISGSVNGSSVSIVTTYLSTFANGYVATFNGSVTGASTMSGTWSASQNGTANGQGGNWSSTLTSGTVTTAKRASATQVMCTYTLADDTDVCTANVGDATGQAGQPTGAVTFSSAVPGTMFAGGGSCTLAQQPGDIGVTSCSVQYEGTETQSLQATASYAGDATFQPSTGSTSFLVAAPGSNAYAPTIQMFDPPTLNAGVNVPPAGATVTVEGDVTSNLTEGATCQIAPETQTPTNESPGAVALTARAKAKAPARSVRVKVVRHYHHGGRVRLALRFNAAALRHDFARSSRLQVIVADATAVNHMWAGGGNGTEHNTGCGLISVTLGTGVAPTVTVFFSGHSFCNDTVQPIFITGMGTATLVSRGVYSYTADGTYVSVTYHIKGQLTEGQSGTTVDGSGTADGVVGPTDDGCYAAVPTELGQTS